VSRDVKRNRVTAILPQRYEAMEIVVRLLVPAIVVIGALLASRPASAQTYDPSYPVCMHVYGVLQGDRIECSFTTLAQCAVTASGLPATCLINPNYVDARGLPPPRPYRSRRARHPSIAPEYY
jgi:Protein of unknown function (DUF3551)